MRVAVDTGVFSAALSRRRRPQFDAQLQRLAGNQPFLAAASVAELRYGALVAGWATARRERLEHAIAATTVIPVSDNLLTTVAETRHACRLAGHPLADRIHTNELWIAASAIHVGIPLLTADHTFVATPGLDLET